MMTLAKLQRRNFKLSLVSVILALALAPVANGQESPQDTQTAAPQGNVSEGKTQLSSQQVNNLPLNGRDFTKLLS